jgi:hypothetical protein
MSEPSRLVDELEREHAGDPWHGSSVSDILRGVTAAQAAAHVVPHVHTIWEVVLHMTAWKNEVRKRLSGAPASTPDEGDWPEVGAPTAERWVEALERICLRARGCARGAGRGGAHDARARAVRTDERSPKSRDWRRRDELRPAARPRAARRVSRRTVGDARQSRPGVVTAEEP